MWSHSAFRLSVLLACLGIAILALLARNGSSSTSAHRVIVARPCTPATPPLAEASWSALESLRRQLLTAMAPLAPTRYVYGTAAPEAAWLDTPASKPSLTRLPDGLWPASYEMRSWTVDPQRRSVQEDIGAEVFVFADAAQADSFFVEASSAYCHRDGVEGSASSPPQARTLTWINPDNAAQEDVFIQRGPRVYRIGVVRPKQDLAPATERQAGLERAAQIACALEDAGCTRSALKRRRSLLRRR
jgi:hypothetical protein